MSTITIKPSDILFCQENIDGKFGRGNNTSLLDTFKKLVSGDLEPSDFPPITVVCYDGKYYAYDGHRRLFLFKVGRRNKLGTSSSTEYFILCTQFDNFHVS